MKTLHKKGGYSPQIANEYIDSKQPVVSLSVQLEKQFKFENKKITDEINCYKAWFSQEGLPPFYVKFETEIELPSYLSLISFDNLQACEVAYNVYFKADDIKVVK